MHEATVFAAEALTEALQHNQPPPNLEALLDPTKAALIQLQQYIHPPQPSNAISDALLRVREPPRVETREHQRPPSQSDEGPIARRTRSGGHKVELANFYASTVVHPTTGCLMEYRQLITDPATRADWQLSTANEFGRLAQGVGRHVQGTNTITFITTTKCPAIVKPPTSAPKDLKNKKRIART
jgi:hypothetical protein